MRRLSLLSGFSMGVLAVSSAHANIQPYYVQVPITSAALAADPTLANFTTWDLRVAVSGITSERFTVATIYGPLAAGTYYSPVGGGDIPVVPVTPNIAYDTYVTIPGYQPGMDPSFIGIPGKTDTPTTGPGTGPGPADFPRAGGQQSLLSATWGSLGLSSGNGDFPIARVTISKDAVGGVDGYVMSNLNNTGQYHYSLDFENGKVAANGGQFALLADANHDNAVNTSDFTAMDQSFNRAGGWGNGDFNGDGIVNALDFNALAINFGADSRAAASLGTLVPEPTTLALFVLAPLITQRRRLR